MENLCMTTRPLMLMAILVLAACTAVPAPVRGGEVADGPVGVVEASVPEFCKTAYEAGPSYTQADISARAAERKAAMPEGAVAPPVTPINRAGPRYPLCAQSYDLEGHCVMVFDVLPDGMTANILPVCTNRIFERDATDAVSRWTFEPPGDGPRPAIMNKLVFKLEDSYYAPAPAAEAGPGTE
jgi:outer membrane biosynthesis protein TonB